MANALTVAYNMGRDDVIHGVDNREAMFVYDNEKAAYQRGYEQELSDLISVVRETNPWR